MTAVEALILILVYFVPAILSYLAIRKNYANKWTFLSPDFGDILFVVVPFVNFIPAIVYASENLAATLDKINIKKSGRTVSQKFFRL